MNRFTPKEIDLIRRHYPDKGAIGMAKMLGGSHSRDTIKGWAHRNNVKVSKAYRTRVAIQANQSWKRSEETRKRIGDGHRKYPVFRCKQCGKRIAHYATYCWGCYSTKTGGERNNNWRGGISSLRSMVDQKLWPVWVYPIMARDRFTCQRCGDSTGHNLNIHHLRTYISIRDSVRKEHPNLKLNNWDDKAKLAQLIVDDHTFDDGITLCKSCHILVHKEKPGELLETPERDNQQPSPPKLEVIVGGKVQRLTGEDSATDKPDTSARHAHA